MLPLYILYVSTDVDTIRQGQGKAKALFSERILNAHILSIVFNYRLYVYVYLLMYKTITREGKLIMKR